MTILSICLPVHNGAATLPRLFDNLLPELSHHFPDTVEVLISDDASSDRSPEIIEDYATRFPFIRYFRNHANLGMDRNFSAAALRATGQYLWFCGQDDVLAPRAIQVFFSILASHPDIDLVYFNYQFRDDDLEVVLQERQVPLQEDAVFHDAYSYFHAFDHAPTFLPAILMRREFWRRTPYRLFFGTHYVQVGVWLYNCLHAKTYFVANPEYVIGCIPKASWKNTSGQMLFEIFTGVVEVYRTVFVLSNKTLPPEPYLIRRRDLLRHLPILMVDLPSKGLRLTDPLRNRLRYLYRDDRKIWFLFVLPLLLTPKPVLYLLQIFRRNTLLSRTLGKLRDILIPRGRP